MLLKDLIEEFNIAANTAFNKGYLELPSELSELAYRFNSGAVSSTKFPITKIMSKIKEFTGNRIHNSPSDAFYVTINNVEFDGSIDIPRRDLLRAQQANSISGLDMYVKEINSLGGEAKDHPYEKMLLMLEAGDASTYGTTFDAQNFFDTTHDFATAAGSQSNMLTGTGASTDATVIADLNSAISALRGFYYKMDVAGGNEKIRPLNNKGVTKLVVVCPSQLVQTFERINKAEYISNNTNVLKGMIDKIIPRAFTDANDWYIMDVSEPNVKPFIISMEEEAKLQSPSEYDYNMKEHKIMTWGLEGFSYGIAYGAWWKAVMVTNT